MFKFFESWQLHPMNRSWIHAGWPWLQLQHGRFFPCFLLINEWARDRANFIDKEGNGRFWDQCKQQRSNQFLGYSAQAPSPSPQRTVMEKIFFFKKAMEKIDQGLFSSVFCNPHSLTFSTKENNTHVMKKSNRIGLQECMHDCSKKLQTSGVASQ